MTFNGIPVMAVDKTKHLGMILDQRLSFENHVTGRNQSSKQGHWRYETIVLLLTAQRS